MKQKEAIKASSSAIAAVVDSDQTTSSHHLLLKSKNKKRLKVIRSFQNPIYHPPLSFSTASNGFELAVPAVAFPILSKVGVEDDGIIRTFNRISLMFQLSLLFCRFFSFEFNNLRFEDAHQVFDEIPQKTGKMSSTPFSITHASYSRSFITNAGKTKVFRYFHFSRRRVPGVRKSQARICLLSDGELLKR
ncbi:unnamed protein product [Lactuca saligna]|uniref:Uncharacterized protein n=1 Tax=Lactuca saligna TaxID=75948 RepID=A0AA35YA95_LACSI|nr:unnamed protein product [Lactuca saligna]